MKRIELQECIFHDSIINDIAYDEKKLKLNLDNFFYDNSYYKMKAEFQLDDFDFNIYFIKQYPLFHKVKITGNECSLNEAKLLFRKGYKLQIVEFLVSTDSNLVILECVLFPYSKKRGVYKKIILKIAYQCKYLTIYE